MCWTPLCTYKHKYRKSDIRYPEDKNKPNIVFKQKSYRISKHGTQTVNTYNRTTPKKIIIKRCATNQTGFIVDFKDTK